MTKIDDKTIMEMLIQEIDINKIYDDLWDARKRDPTKEQVHIDMLASNISHHGLLEPIWVKPRDDKKGYSIIAGRSRAKACKQLGWNKIPARIFDNLQNHQIISMTITENTHRENLNPDEKLDALVMHFTVRGYTPEQIIHLAKKIHNFGTKDIPESFLDAVEVSGYAPNTIYEMMQIVLYLPPALKIAARNAELSIQKRQLLTNRRLREHPKIALKLLEDIRGMPPKKARVAVRQKIMDLETGATIKSGDSYVTDYSKREKVDTKIEIGNKSAADYYLDLVDTLTTLLYQSTGYRLNQYITTYEPKHVENTEKHRIEILKGLTDGELKKLENDLDILDEVTQSWLDLIHREIMSRKDRKVGVK